MDLAEDVREKVQRQVEFYFSDSNLPRDKFLNEKVAADPDGFVDIALLCTFSRMKALLKHAATKPEDVPAVTVQAVAAVLKGVGSLAMNDAGTRVKRTTPLPDAERASKLIDERSLYAAPLPFDATLDAVQDLFAKHGPVNCVRFRRHLASKDFKGSVFVEFTSKEAAEEVLGKSLVFEGAPLRLQRKPEYVAAKADERRNKPAEPTTPAPPGQPQPKAAEEEPREVSVPEGAHLRVTFEPDADLNEVNWRGVSELLGGREAGIRHVSFKQANLPANEALVRFNSAEAAVEALRVTEDGTIKVAGVPATVKAVTGEEDAALRATLEELFRNSNAKQRGGPGRGGRGGAGRGRGRGRKRSRDD